MIKTVLHKIFASLLALLVLLSTISFTVNKHFCGDKLIGVSVFNDVDKCEVDIVKTLCCPNESLTMKSCCSETSDVITGQNQLDITKLKIHKQLFLTAYFYSYKWLYDELPCRVIFTQEYSSLFLVKDIHILDEVYLI